MGGSREARGESPCAERGREAQLPEAVNRAILRFDPDEPADEARLRAVVSHWGLDPAAIERLVAAWRKRPKLEKRLNLSRRAILNLVPYMEKCHDQANRWPTQQEARKAHAKALQDQFDETGEDADRIAARRYATGAAGLRAADRYYMRLRKHQISRGGNRSRRRRPAPLRAASGSNGIQPGRPQSDS